MANYWTEKSGKILTTLDERVTTTFDLPLKSIYLPITNNNMTVSIVSGDIPKGMKLSGHSIVGTPYEVNKDTKYTFVVRADQNGVIDERTFSIIVTGADEPVWTTPADLLPVGPNDTFYIIDSAPLDFQLVATDPDTSAGDAIEYYIQEGDGEIPPGITLQRDGRLTGIVEPILALEKAANTGEFDTNVYGAFPYDFGVRPDNGFESFFYDTTTFDLSVPSRAPKKLNRFYEFRVSASDGESVVKRQFRIYVVGDDFLRADNTVMRVANGVFTADNTNIRVPIWLTPANFGFRRSNNYVTLFLDTLDPNSSLGVISYSLRPLNDDGSTSTLPDGLALDATTGEIAGLSSYQPAVTKEFKFTIRATRQSAVSDEASFKDKTFTVTMLGEINSVLTWSTDANLGIISSNYISTKSIAATTTVPKARLLFTLVSGELPPGLNLSFDGEIIGKINSFGTPTAPGLTVFDNNNFKLDGNTTFLDREFKFTARVQDHFGYSAITREFTIKVTDPDDKLYSNLFVQPFMKTNKRQDYEAIISNTNLFDSDIIYRPNDPAFGIQKSMRMLIFAGIETKTINYYVAAASKNHKRKRYQLGEVKSAIANTPGTQNTVYEVVYVEVIEQNDGLTKASFSTSNPNKITADQVMYSTEDDTVENLDPTGLIIGTRRYGDVEHFFYPNFKIGTRTGEFISNYDPLVIDRVDGFDATIYPNVVGTSDPYRFRPIPENTVKVDSENISVDGATENRKYISNVTHMRKNIRAIGETELNFLPLWMRTSQPGQIDTLGYVKAIPLCYVKPGNSTQVLNAIRNANIKFNQFDFDIDRYVIDSTEGESSEQYILFHNYQHNV